MTLKAVYEHSFNRNAFNFCSGAFGKSNKELLCVQSVDGTLFFLENESFLFKVQLPDFVIPGPFVYASAIDFGLSSFTDSGFVSVSEATTEDSS